MNPLWWEVIDSGFTEVNIDNVEAFFATSTRVARPVLIAWAAHFCLSEVQNGGLLQFFWNSTGLLAPEAIAGFEALKMPQLASRLAHATALLGTPYPRNRDERWDALLVNSEKTEEELKTIFETSEVLFLKFRKATGGLGFDALESEIYTLAQTENGGFDKAAEAFLMPWCQE